MEIRNWDKILNMCWKVKRRQNEIEKKFFKKQKKNGEYNTRLEIESER